MTNKTKPSKALQDKYGRYKTLGKFQKNYVAKIEKHLAKFPNDEVAKKALTAVPTFKTKPINKLGWMQKTKDTNQQTIRKADAMHTAQINKFSLKNKQLCTKTVSKNISINPFLELQSIRAVLPVFQYPEKPKQKYQNKG